MGRCFCLGGAVGISVVAMMDTIFLVLDLSRIYHECLNLRQNSTTFHGVSAFQRLV